MVSLTRQGAASFTDIATGRLYGDSADMKSSKEDSLWGLEKKYYCSRMFWFKLWTGRKEMTHIIDIFTIAKIFQGQEKRKKESSGKNQANWTSRAQGTKEG